MAPHKGRLAIKSFDDLLPAPRSSLPLTPSRGTAAVRSPEERASPCGCSHAEAEALRFELPDAGSDCFKDKDFIAPKGTVPKIGFELDLNYGASTRRPPLAFDDPDRVGTETPLEGKNITRHRINKEGFRLEGDGNRIEIGTKRFDLTGAGRLKMHEVLEKVLEVVDDLKTRCAAAEPDIALGYPQSTGAPRHFVFPDLQSPAACVFSLTKVRKRKDGPLRPYYASDCSIAAAPQATFDLPLAKIDELVAIIESSESKRVPGRAFSGPSWARQGLRSKALYEARDAVNQSRAAHIQAGTLLSNQTEVTESSFSPTLVGLLILMVSYLRTSDLTYIDGVDYEKFAKSYLPLNVKNPFRLLFADLTDTEKRVFNSLYDNPRTKLWRLARPGATAADGGTKLFPARVHGNLRCFFDPLPTWNDFVQKTIENTPHLRNKICSSKKKGEGEDCEVLFAPLSRILPYETGSRRVTVEMRRLAFDWVYPKGREKNGRQHPGWAEMTETLFDLAQVLNK